ncbi:MAG: hypothetical protein V1881_04030 [Candidatus Micrarchaeota archaeon]
MPDVARLLFLALFLSAPVFAYDHFSVSYAAGASPPSFDSIHRTASVVVSSPDSSVLLSDVGVVEVPAPGGQPDFTQANDARDCFYAPKTVAEGHAAAIDLEFDPLCQRCGGNYYLVADVGLAAYPQLGRQKLRKRVVIPCKADLLIVTNGKKLDKTTEYENALRTYMRTIGSEGTLSKYFELDSDYAKRSFGLSDAAILSSVKTSALASKEVVFSLSSFPSSGISQIDLPNGITTAFIKTGSAPSYEFFVNSRRGDSKFASDRFGMKIYSSEYPAENFRDYLRDESYLLQADDGSYVRIDKKPRLLKMTDFCTSEMSSYQENPDTGKIEYRKKTTPLHVCSNPNGIDTAFDMKKISAGEPGMVVAVSFFTTRGVLHARCDSYERASDISDITNKLTLSECSFPVSDLLNEKTLACGACTLKLKERVSLPEDVEFKIKISSQNNAPESEEVRTEKFILKTMLSKTNSPWGVMLIGDYGVIEPFPFSDKDASPFGMLLGGAYTISPDGRVPSDEGLADSGVSVSRIPTRGSSTEPVSIVLKNAVKNRFVDLPELLFDSCGLAEQPGMVGATEACLFRKKAEKVGIALYGSICDASNTNCFIAPPYCAQIRSTGEDSFPRTCEENKLRSLLSRTTSLYVDAHGSGSRFTAVDENGESYLIFDADYLQAAAVPNLGFFSTSACFGAALDVGTDGAALGSDSIPNILVSKGVRVYWGNTRSGFPQGSEIITRSIVIARNEKLPLGKAFAEAKGEIIESDVFWTSSKRELVFYGDPTQRLNPDAFAPTEDMLQAAKKQYDDAFFVGCTACTCAPVMPFPIIKSTVGDFCGALGCKLKGDSCVGNAPKCSELDRKEQCEAFHGTWVPWKPPEQSAS